jgi:ABC-2 type transport system permease protein
MFLSSRIHQLENFAGVMNFLIFPMFFMSSALYPLWRVREGSVWLYELCRFNPFTYIVELVRSTLYLQFNATALAVVVGTLVLFGALALIGYTPARGGPAAGRAGAGG